MTEIEHMICAKLVNTNIKNVERGMNMVKKIEQNNMQDALNAKVAVVDFSATWCGPCQTMGPVVDELAQELTDVKVGKVNVDEQMALAREYKVMSIPTFLVFKDGKVAERTLGVQEKSELEQLIR